MTTRWVDTATALLVATAGLAVIVYPVVSTVALFLPAGTGTAALAVTVVVALGGASPIVAGERSVRRLWEFAVVVTLCQGAGGLLALFAVDRFAALAPVAFPTLRAAVLAGAYPTATLLVFRERLLEL